MSGMGHNGGPELDVELTDPQHELVTTSARFPAMVAGFGAGKTQALVQRALAYKFKYPTCNVAYYLPTYDLVTTIAIPRFIEALEGYGMFEKVHYVINVSKKMIVFFGGGSIILRTMDNPGRIVGYEVADSLVDELDTLKAEDASNVWNKIIARNRQKKPDDSDNTIAVGTTPEGFRFVYNQWYKSPPSSEYQLIKATTYSNARNLPKNYIQDLKDAYPAQLIEAYLNGEFVNLTSGSVYASYNRQLNNSSERIVNYVDPFGVRHADSLHIGLDFNVTKMAAVIHVYRQADPHAVGELVDMFDTPAFIKAVKERYQSQGHPIFVYPDASGNARKSNNASETDIALLRQANFEVMVNASNPFVRDRIVSMNVMFERRRYRVNADACPNYSSALEQQVYDKNGDPEKTSGKDHINDAGGYFISKQFPVAKPSHSKATIGGI